MSRAVARDHVPPGWRVHPPPPPSPLVRSTVDVVGALPATVAQLRRIGGTDGPYRIGPIRQRRGLEGHEEREGRDHPDILPATALRAGGQRGRGRRCRGPGQARTAIGGLKHAIETRLGGGHPHLVEGGEHARLGEALPGAAGGVEAPHRQGQGREGRAGPIDEAVRLGIGVGQTEGDRTAEGGAATRQGDGHQRAHRRARERPGGPGRVHAVELEALRRGQGGRREVHHHARPGDHDLGHLRHESLRLALVVLHNRGRARAAAPDTTGAP